MASSVSYQNKRALIVGINKYPHDPLKYCINDAEDLGATLQGIGFDTSLVENCNMNIFYRALDTFINTIQRKDLVLFYFAGHGKQVGDQNYLLPSDYNYNHKGYEHDYIGNHAINVQYIMQKIDERNCRITIYLFDCCRKLVKTRATNENQGLLPMNALLQTLIVFGCAPGKQVMDETFNKRNGPFIENLLKHIGKPNKDIEEIMKNVARDVMSQTDGFQLPYRTSSLTYNTYLAMDNSQDFTSDKNDFLLKLYLHDPEYDRDYTNITDTGENFTRGGVKYCRPYGWKRYALKVIDKYEDEEWLGKNNGPNEWPVSYHGTTYEAAKSIAQVGYNLKKHRTFAYGHGIYSAPDIKVAIAYSKSFTLNAQEYLIIIQNRVNPANIIKLSDQETGIGECWISPKAADIRPYGLCVMKLDDVPYMDYSAFTCLPTRERHRIPKPYFRPHSYGVGVGVGIRAHLVQEILDPDQDPTN